MPWHITYGAVPVVHFSYSFPYLEHKRYPFFIAILSQSSNHELCFDSNQMCCTSSFECVYFSLSWLSRLPRIVDLAYLSLSMEWMREFASIFFFFFYFAYFFSFFAPRLNNIFMPNKQQKICYILFV